MMEIIDLGSIDYQEAWSLQRKYVDKVIANQGNSYLLLCEHPPVLTLGRLADRSHILFSEDKLRQQGIPVIAVDRGGDVTLHAPGQLVVYVIANLQRYGKDLHGYLHQLEQVGIDFLKLFDIMGYRIPGKTGVWVNGRKMISAGIGVKRWISYHGISINIHTDLSLFDMIYPCGMDVSMTSVEQEAGVRPAMEDVKEKVSQLFQQELGMPDERN
jgi:lipoate-protein ligase B